MILKTAANYNDEGGYIEAWKNSDGTTEVKLIPKSGGGDEGKNGIKSISISPAITTTPALDSQFPIYYEDLTAEQKESGVILLLTSDDMLVDGAEYTFTITPTTDMYIIIDEPGEKGEPVTFTAPVDDVEGVDVLRFFDVFVTSTTGEPTEEDKFFKIGMNISRIQ